jgi:hypothetical protein
MNFFSKGLPYFDFIDSAIFLDKGIFFNILIFLHLFVGLKAISISEIISWKW